MITIGVLALQGDFEAHRNILEAQGVRVIKVRDAQSLQECDGLIIPGGESTVMSQLCERYGLWEPLQARLAAGMAAFGTCAGMILLAKGISGASRNFEQQTLGALDIDVARNAYGAQVDSFEADIEVPPVEAGESAEPLRAVFIRAPQIVRCGEAIEVLARHGDQPVVVRQGKLMASSFHPEISGDARLHQLWLKGVEKESGSEIG
ncbi:MAG: pyridoxal 5'-phosphate synthase glutaminase subunit PdxT [Abitibacteriaceae bacterium]|nr:pyridoxal 5'-phosphate synthase glutaminase subunit PdxT [Abditibacteriaceae bacterium]